RFLLLDKLHAADRAIAGLVRLIVFVHRAVVDIPQGGGACRVRFSRQQPLDPLRAAQPFAIELPRNTCGSRDQDQRQERLRQRAPPVPSFSSFSGGRLGAPVFLSQPQNFKRILRFIRIHLCFPPVNSSRFFAPSRLCGGLDASFTRQQARLRRAARAEQAPSDTPQGARAESA